MKLKIAVDGKSYDVEVEVAEQESPILGAGGYVPMASPVRVPAPLPSAAPSAGAPVENEEKVCRSPISGIVVRINAQPGQRIQVGDPLLVLEAMKMETNITAPVAAMIARLLVNAGDSVQGGQVLVEFE